MVVLWRWWKEEVTCRKTLCVCGVPCRWGRGPHSKTRPHYIVEHIAYSNKVWNLELFDVGMSPRSWITNRISWVVRCTDIPYLPIMYSGFMYSTK